MTQVEPRLKLVLWEPEIPANTGNIGRTCVGLNAELHLVGRRAFRLNDKYLKRAGLDYWQHLKLFEHSHWEQFLEFSGPNPPLYFFENEIGKNFWQAQFASDAYLVFGPETRGLPQAILNLYKNQIYHIPMTGPIRSLNVSNAAALVLYEAFRQNVAGS